MSWASHNIEALEMRITALRIDEGMDEEDAADFDRFPPTYDETVKAETWLTERLLGGED